MIALCVHLFLKCFVIITDGNRVRQDILSVIKVQKNIIGSADMQRGVLVYYHNNIIMLVLLLLLLLLLFLS